jgi:tetratricopeptide (TPR) repeat protein
MFMAMLSQHKAKLAVLFVGLLTIGVLAYLLSITNPHPFPLVKTDRFESWETPAPYKDGGELEERALGEIQKLEDAKGSDEYSDYDIYVGIAQWKELMGDGKAAYEYLGKAIKENPERSLAYGNLGHLMKKIGAFGTAKEAFLKAIEVEPQFRHNYIAYIDFLIRDAPGVSVANVEEAFAMAFKEHPDSTELKTMYAEWRKNTGQSL